MVKDLIIQNQSVKANTATLEKLHRDFPDCFNANGEFDMEKFQSLVSQVTDITQEGYDLNFLGKSYARLISSTETLTVLTPDEEHNQKPENKNSQNIYISGDNLDALKHLRKSYHEAVKCIYIDPPYNTGSDGFVYNDSFDYTIEELATKLDITEEKAKRILDFTRKGSASHSAWLTFMACRLLIARDLLTPDGVIFISIDDNEQANLKLLCDSVFGEENFIVDFPRITKKGGKSSAEVARNHDYVLMFVKNIEKAGLVGVGHNDNSYCLQDEYFEKRGYYKLNQTLDYDSLGYVKTLDYPIEIEGKIFYAGGSKEEYEKRQSGSHGRADWGWRWRWSEDLYKFGSENGFIVVKGNRIYTKTYQKVKIVKEGKEYKLVEIDRTKPLSTIEFTNNQYSNDNAKKSIDSLFEKGIFEYTKPPILIEDIQKLVNGAQYIILDFFSGSATTAHAVMQLNAQDGGNRKYIMVQLPEKVKEGSEAEKAGYKTIDQIGQERIRRAAKKIKEEMEKEIEGIKQEIAVLENKQSEKKLFEDEQLKTQISEKQDLLQEKQNRLNNMDFGFKHYTLNTPNPDTLDKMDKFNPKANLAFADEDIKTQFGNSTILTTWVNSDGYGLNAEIKEVKLDTYTAYLCGKHLYFLDTDFGKKDAVKLIERYGNDKDFAPQTWVLFGYSFTLSQTEMLKKNAPTIEAGTKNIKVNLSIRY